MIWLGGFVESLEPAQKSRESREKLHLWESSWESCTVSAGAVLRDLLFFLDDDLILISLLSTMRWMWTVWLLWWERKQNNRTDCEEGQTELNLQSRDQLTTAQGEIASKKIFYSTLEIFTCWCKKKTTECKKSFVLKCVSIAVLKSNFDPCRGLHLSKYRSSLNCVTGVVSERALSLWNSHYYYYAVLVRRNQYLHSKYRCVGTCPRYVNVWSK